MYYIQKKSVQTLSSDIYYRLKAQHINS